MYLVGFLLFLVDGVYLGERGHKLHSREWSLAKLSDGIILAVQGSPVQGRAIIIIGYSTKIPYI